MFDEHGTPVGQPAYLENPSRYDTFRNHEPMRPTDVEGVGLMAPLGAALSAGQGMGPVFLGGPLHLPHVVLAVAFDPKLGGGKRILAAEVSLRKLAAYVASLSTGEVDVKLVDPRARLFASGARGGPALLETQPVPGGGREGELPPHELVAEYVDQGRRLIGAYAPVQPWGLGAIAQQDGGRGLGPRQPHPHGDRAVDLRVRVSGFAGGGNLGAATGRPSGRAGQRLPPNRHRKPGDPNRGARGGRAHRSLARAFNRMAGGLEEARRKIDQQTGEIVAWNQSLEKCVDEKAAELRQTQDLLLRSRSLSALGELGAGVAHEINNPLTGALGIVQLLLTDLPPGHPSAPLLADLEREALRIRKIVQNMLRLSQRQSGHDTTAVDLARVLDDAIELCGPSDLAAAGVEIVRRYDPAPTVRASATQLEEAFIQLIQNGRAAMPAGGRLTLELRPVEDSLVRLVVSDTGSGISAENVPRIFDPFFTTKAGDQGSGLGLSFVHRIVEDNGGTIQVESVVGSGTKFTLTFPADAGRAHRP